MQAAQAMLKLCYSAEHSVNLPRTAVCTVSWGIIILCAAKRWVAHWLCISTDSTSTLWTGETTDTHFQLCVLFIGIIVIFKLIAIVSRLHPLWTQTWCQGLNEKDALMHVLRHNLIEVKCSAARKNVDLTLSAKACQLNPGEFVH